MGSGSTLHLSLYECLPFATVFRVYDCDRMGCSFIFGLIAA
jgi:hypothetical protein